MKDKNSFQVENYKAVVKEILDLNWDSLNEEDLQKLMILSGYSALEFADSLRLTLKLYPKNGLLKEMADEELKTKNLSFGDYDTVGDHSQFLWYFIEKYLLIKKFPDLRKQGDEYIKKIKNLPEDVRVMSIVSR